MKLAMEFDYDKAELKGNFSTQLTDIGAFMKANPGARIDLLGCTDDHGTDDYNITLSGARAKAVMKHLVDVEGLAAGRMTAKGIGKGKPAADNQTEEGRQRNRRVIAVLTIAK
jgi:OOP family OmpA-OmpF porin